MHLISEHQGVFFSYYLIVLEAAPGQSAAGAAIVLYIYIYIYVYLLVLFDIHVSFSDGGVSAKQRLVRLRQELP